MTLKQGLKNKDFTRRKREKRSSRQKEQHDPRPGKAQGKLRERAMTWQRYLFRKGMGKGKPAKSPVCYNTGLSGGGQCRVRPARQDQVLQWSECAGQARAAEARPGELHLRANRMPPL